MDKQAAPAELFSGRLRAARKLRGLTQAKLAEKTGIMRNTITYFEKGTRKPSFDNLNHLIQALDVTADYLMGRTNNPSMSTDADQIYRRIQNLSGYNKRLVVNFLNMLDDRKVVSKRNRKLTL